MTLTDWHHWVEQALSPLELESPSREARWLIAAALNQDPSFLVLSPSYCPTTPEEEKIRAWTLRRARGEPLSRLKGIREFWSLSFHLNPQTLDPRPDSETLIEGVLHWMGKEKTKPWRLLDLGTGSGCLLISLLHECPNATGIGVDQSEDALKAAQFNAALHKVSQRASFFQGHWAENLEGFFDIIISNPPYIPLRDKDSLPRAVHDFDPPLALFGGEDGLDAYRVLSRTLRPLLCPSGLIALEIGHTQGQAVETLFHHQGFHTALRLKDLAGKDRVLGFACESPILSEEKNGEMC